MSAWWGDEASGRADAVGSVGGGRWLTWRSAMDRALYGADGFYLHERPSRHFRTSVSASPLFAAALLRVLMDLDARFGRPTRLDLVDIGAGEGTLVRQIHKSAPPDLRDRLRVTAVDLAPRPPDLPESIAWARVPPKDTTGLMIANEWLDNVPLDVAEQTADGPRLVLVDPETGDERLGPPLPEADRAWVARWWPLHCVGERAEIGRPRDEAWAAVLARLAWGCAIAVDYAHTLADRPRQGTITGYRDGTTVAPVPDGSCDITAHVALDSCAAAGERAGATATALTTQRRALRALGCTGERPALELAQRNPRGYLARLARSAEEAELIDPAGLGGFAWLRQEVGEAPGGRPPRGVSGGAAERGGRG
jgi:SAM-dependent MidA family methyltransferase